MSTEGRLPRTACISIQPCGEIADSTHASGIAVCSAKSRFPVALRVVAPVTGGFNSTNHDSFAFFFMLFDSALVSNSVILRRRAIAVVLLSERMDQSSFPTGSEKCTVTASSSP